MSRTIQGFHTHAVPLLCTDLHLMRSLTCVYSTSEVEGHAGLLPHFPILEMLRQIGLDC